MATVKQVIMHHGVVLEGRAVAKWIVTMGYHWYATYHMGRNMDGGVYTTTDR